jgi:hypothetical protein
MSKAAELFEKMRETLMKSIPEEEKEKFRKLGEKFHSSFDVGKAAPVDLSVINMEESLAYVVEQLKSGLHPSFLTEDEKAIVEAGYGPEWYTNWDYTKEDLELIPAVKHDRGA